MINSSKTAVITTYIILTLYFYDG